MRPRRLLVPLTLTLALAPATPAMAADFTVDVREDFSFAPENLAIGLGDTVTWTFTSGGHTTTAVRGQADSWDSGLLATGATFPRTFSRPGRFQYICQPHESFMTGTITVGTDAEADTVDGVRTRKRGRSATVSFTLNEAARMSLAVKGPSDRTVKRSRLRAGKQRFTVRRLSPGSYRATLTLTDDFDKRVRTRSRFVIR